MSMMKMKENRVWAIVAGMGAVFAVSILITACAKAPGAEMVAAREAVARAENDPDVAAYATSTLARARGSLANMEAEAQAKRYESARNYADEAYNGALKAISDARAAAARAQDDSASALNALRDAVGETDLTIEQGKKNNLALDWNQIDNSYRNAQITASEAEAAAAASRYRDAVERANAARTTLSGINARISGASLAVTRKK